MGYKPTYTKEEIAEIVNWFSAHKFEQDIDMGSGIHIRDILDMRKNIMKL